MKTRIGLESFLDKDNLKKLEKGNVLWSVQWDSDTNKVTPLPLIFKEFVKAPGNKDGVWGVVTEAIVNEKGEFSVIVEKDEKGVEKELSHVTDLSIGVFLDKVEALKRFKEEMENIVDACQKAIDLENMKEKE